MGLTKPRAAQIYDIDYKQATRVITTTNITLAGGAPSLVDGVNLTLKDRVLVTGQTNAAQNGIYFVTTLGSGANGTWTRSTDTDVTGELLAGTIVMVTEGLIYADTQWKLVTDDPIVIGTSLLIFEQNSAFAFGNVYANGTAVLASSVGDVLTLSAGNNISISGNNASKTVTIGVTGISLNSISNGTSNVNVVSPNGNVTVGVAGTGNVAVFSSTGANITGTLGVSGNITSGNLSGTSIAGTLTTAAQTNITSVGTLSSLTVTANVAGGNLTTAGQVVATGNVSGGNLTTTGLIAGGSISTVGNVTAGNLSISNNVTISGNLSVTGNATLSGNILGDRIQNGTTSIDIQTPSGNANISIGGTSNVAVFSTTGANITGTLGVTGNITGANILGNGAGLTGINTFSNISVTGGNSATADSIADTLTLTAGSGITLVMNPDTDTLTIAATSGSETFVDGADFGTVTEIVTVTDDLGLVTDAVTAESDLGTIVTSGLIYPDQFVLPSFTTTTLPSAGIAGAMIYVTNETGGAVPAFADGTNWRRVTDRAIVS
jgi:hypothetical protein